MPDPKIFFWIARSVFDVALNPTGITNILANGMSTFFINSKPADINGLTKLRNPPSWLIIFEVVAFNKIPQFLKEQITFVFFFNFIVC